MRAYRFLWGSPTDSWISPLSPRYPFELYLALNNVEHRHTKVCHPFTNGFVERFHSTVLDEFFRTAFRTKFYATVDQLQADLDEWLAYYNTERPHQGYRKPVEAPASPPIDHVPVRDDG